MALVQNLRAWPHPPARRAAVWRNDRLQTERLRMAPAAAGRKPMWAGSSAQNDIDAVKDLRARLRTQTPDSLGEE
jgi:hypothetical protein